MQLQIFDILHNTQKSLNAPPIPTAAVGVVTNNNDPSNLRRVKVVTSDKPNIESDWLWCVQPTTDHDDVMPSVGSTVLITFLDGNNHRGVWHGVLVNETNQPLDKQSATKDRYKEIPGNDDLKVVENITVNVGKTFRLQNDAGCYLELNEAGFIILGSTVTNQRWTLGSGSSGNGWQWDCGGAEVRFSNVSDVTIENKSVLTIGSQDDDGDISVTRGY
ncbi:hypothetical protein BLD44_028535 [Mastigocladus laminosus UU774]|nr:hypothetical protein BLD44_028535 [Mastigocladus laminosus UU774]